MIDDQKIDAAEMRRQIERENRIGLIAFGLVLVVGLVFVLSIGMIVSHTIWCK